MSSSGEPEIMRSTKDVVSTWYLFFEFNIREGCLDWYTFKIHNWNRTSPDWELLEVRDLVLSTTVSPVPLRVFDPYLVLIIVGRLNK